MPSENPDQVKRTLIGGKYVVSTIQRTTELKLLDLMIVKHAKQIGLDEDEIAAERGGLSLSDPGGYESMVFECDADGKVTNWTELKGVRYDSREAAELGHDELVNIYYEEYSNGTS